MPCILPGTYADIVTAGTCAAAEVQELQLQRILHHVKLPSPVTSPADAPGPCQSEEVDAVIRALLQEECFVPSFMPPCENDAMDHGHASRREASRQRIRNAQLKIIEPSGCSSHKALWLC